MKPLLWLFLNFVFDGFLPCLFSSSSSSTFSTQCFFLHSNSCTDDGSETLACHQRFEFYSHRQISIKYNLPQQTSKRRIEIGLEKKNRNKKKKNERKKRIVQEIISKVLSNFLSFLCVCVLALILSRTGNGKIKTLWSIYFIIMKGNSF